MPSPSPAGSPASLRARTARAAFASPALRFQLLRLAAKTPSALHAGSCPPVRSTAARIQRDLYLSSAKPQLRKTKISQNPPSIHRHKPVPPGLDPPFALLEFHCKFNIYRSDLSIPREMSNSLILLGLKIRGGRTGASIRFSLCTASKRKIIASGFLKGRSKNAHKIQLK